ncbi:hypothetical protein [Streptomyces sp. NPDC059597]|uniref:hypothetical protein n=1 Tax=Streptomyces sp. NPDC059597 TaxID=3346879 RepID=UPI0036857EF6
MRAADQTTYIEQCIREAASMYEDDARRFLAEHDAHVRTKAFTEAADVVGNDDDCDCGGCSTCVPRQLAAKLRRMAGEQSTELVNDATPDFFIPGRTYAYKASGFTAPELLTKFRVVAITTHPENGKRMAFGWIHAAEDATWSPYAEPADEWPACWTDVTDTTQGDRT